MIDFVPLDRSQRIAGAGAAAASRPAVAGSTHMRIDRFRGRTGDDDAREQDRFEHGDHDDAGTYSLPTSATPAAPQGDAKRAAGYSNPREQPHRHPDTPQPEDRVDFVA